MISPGRIEIGVAPPPFKVLDRRTFQMPPECACVLAVAVAMELKRVAKELQLMPLPPELVDDKACFGNGRAPIDMFAYMQGLAFFLYGIVQKQVNPNAELRIETCSEADHKQLLAEALASAETARQYLMVGRDTWMVWRGIEDPWPGLRLDSLNELLLAEEPLIS